MGAAGEAVLPHCTPHRGATGVELFEGLQWSSTASPASPTLHIPDIDMGEHEREQ